MDELNKGQCFKNNKLLLDADYTTMENDFSVEFNYSIDKDNCFFFKDPSKVRDIKRSENNMSSLELLDKLDAIVDCTIRLYYKMETTLLAYGKINKELWKQLSTLKRLNRVYKKRLNLPNAELLDLPYDVEKDYKDLLKKITEVINRTKDKIKALSHKKENMFLVKDYNLKLIKFVKIKKLYEVFLNG